ncbi:universal stress protein, partial [Streptomyces sp. SID6139]|nr:universal stress protein [Streptomyces sp. SID6139]
MSGYDAVGRVVVGVSGSLGSVTALRRAGALARRLGAELWPVLAWEPPGGDPATRRSAAAA